MDHDSSGTSSVAASISASAPPSVVPPKVSSSGSGIRRQNTNPEIDPYVKSQVHLLQATENNPLPTAVPPPIAANAGTLGVRHVLCVIGLPERGKPYIARRLLAYLSFFHGAEVQIFNLLDYQRGEPGCDANADALIADLRAFMSKENVSAAQNMHVKRDISDPSPENVLSSLLVDEKDRRRKNVDSGKVAIIMSTDSHAAFKDKWSGTSKERRQWASQQLASDKQMNAKLIYIEIIVNQPDLIEANIRAKRRSLGLGETSTVALRDHNNKVKQYSRMYVTLQDDGSEDDLSYIKLYNYGGKVVTNRMHGYLRMRIAQFLTTVHTVPHVIYLSRHGQSEYNVLGKIGGNPPLSESGKQYAVKLGQWVPANICQTPEGRPIKSRLWTSSLQRTILTAEHIPHPIVELAAFGDANCDVTDELDALRLPSSAATAPAGAESRPAALPASNGTVSRPPSFVGGCGATSGGAPAAQAPTSPSSTAAVQRGPSYREEMRKMDCLSSGASPPPELCDVDIEGVWEQMSPRVYRNLDEIFAGEYEGMRYEEIKRLRPDEASLRAMDKIGYRYPRGESYFDILSRLDPLVHELESYHEPLLVVSHQAVLRVLYAYLLGKPRSSAPKIEIPLHTVMKITYDGWNEPKEERFYLGPEPIAIVPDEPPASDPPRLDGRRDSSSSFSGPDYDGQRHL